MVATIDEEIAPRVGELSALYVFNPGAIDPDGDIMFGLARNRTGMATNTLALVDDKCILCHWLPFSERTL
ncbi:MAG: hypothetical protein PVS3B3_29520 [Ktedonobacteraceae bacterium]